MRRPRWPMLALVTIAALLVPARSVAQDPPSPPSTPPAATGSSSSNAKPQKYSHVHDFLIIGTVFSEKGYAYPGSELRIRRANEKKFRWDTQTNSRGEFAVRVPQGADYEMLVRAKGFADQTRSVDAKSGLSEARMVFRMEPPVEKK